MIRKFMVAIGLVLILAVPAAVYAGCGACEGDTAAAKGCCMKVTCCKVTDMAQMLMDNKDTLGLSEAQMASIKASKAAYGTDSGAKKVEMKAVADEITEKMYEDVIDMPAVNALIDQKYELKKEKAKMMVAALNEMKMLMTPDQQAKAREMCKGCCKGKEGSSKGSAHDHDHGSKKGSSAGY